ncbi:FUSC family protein [Dyella silvatica]|uniref:FUSC family protein n=1 Tax=Dyella silvatica TaxID=2992128 RepID=UPI002254C748|nr:FUSC family protein [Dyella silvatica]
MPPLFQRYHAEFRLVIRATVAAALSLLIAEALHLPQGYWAVITALLIVQASIGGTLQAGLDRLLGTIAGAAVGAAASLIGGLWPIPPLIVLLLAVAPLAFLAALRSNFRIAPTTAAIVLLANNSHVSPLVSASHRVIEIGLGTLIGIAVSIVLLPARARRLGAERSAQALGLIAELLGMYATPSAQRVTGAIHTQNARIRAELDRVESAAHESRREHLTRVAADPIPERLVRNLRRVHSDTVFVSRALAGWEPSRDAAPLFPAFSATVESTRQTILVIAQSLAGTGAPAALDDLDRHIAALQRSVDAFMTQTPEIPLRARQATVLPFVFETLRRDLADLIQAADPADPADPP